MASSATKRGRTRTRSQPPTVRALERGLLVLEALGHDNDAALSEVARKTNLTCSTTFRLLETLRQKGYVDQDELTGRYRLGAGALGIGASYSAKLPLPEAGSTALRRLVEITGETANLAVLSGVQAVYVHQIESQRSVRMFTQLGSRAPVHCTGVGKALLAWLPQEQVEQLLADIPFEVFTENTIRTLSQFVAELEVVSRQGFAVDDEEREMGVRCVAAPVRDARGVVVAALSVSSPAVRLPKKAIAQCAREVKSAADDISVRLGCLNPPPSG
jgi:IclR family acetate operon transcriptional repressor